MTEDRVFEVMDLKHCKKQNCEGWMVGCMG